MVAGGPLECVSTEKEERNAQPKFHRNRDAPLLDQHPNHRVGVSWEQKKNLSPRFLPLHCPRLMSCTVHRNERCYLAGDDQISAAWRLPINDKAKNLHQRLATRIRFDRSSIYYLIDHGT